MDLFSTIFEDKRSKRPKDPTRQKVKSSQSERTKNRTKQATPTNDKRLKATNRSISQNELRPKNTAKNGIVKSVSNAGHHELHHSEVRNETIERLPDKQLGHSKIVIDNSGIQPSPSLRSPVERNGRANQQVHCNHIDPTILRNVNPFFPQSDEIEDNFESALEVYNDCTFDEKDNDFGRESFTTLDKDYFVEAYNRHGGEVIQSSVQVTFATKTEYPSEHTPQYIEEHKLDKTNIFISDEDDNYGTEAYNSLGNEIRQISISGTSSSATQRNTIERIGKSSNIQVSTSFMNDLTHRNSTEKESQEIKSIQEIANQKLFQKNATRDKKTLNNSYRKKKLQRSGSASLDEENEEDHNSDTLNATIDASEVAHGKLGLIHNNDTPQDATVDRASSFASNASSNVSRKNSTASAGSYTLDHTHDEIIEVPEQDEWPSFKCTFKPITKADMVIYELLETEDAYIRNLEKIKRDYILYFTRLNLDTREMFGNILEILEHTKDLYHSLLICENNYEHIAMTFVDYKFIFDLYPEYSKNKWQADAVLTRVKAIIKDRQRKLGDKLDLSSYLLNPIQRLGRYILLLENLRKCVRKSECLGEAITILKHAMTRGNDYVAIGSILGCPKDIDLSQKGTFVGRDSFTMLKPRKEETWIFLFQDIVVFTVPCVGMAEKFEYKGSIKMNDLAITCIEGNDREFRLKNYPMAKKGKEELATYIFEARSVKLKAYWTNLIETRLWEQLNNFKAQSKKYAVAKPDQKVPSDASPTDGASTSKLTSNVARRGTATSDYNQKTKRKSQFYIESNKEPDNSITPWRNNVLLGIDSVDCG